MQLNSANSDGNGFVKLWYKMKHWVWANDPATCHLFIHLLLAANWQDNQWNGQIIKRGDLVFSRRNWAERTGLTERQIRTSLQKLISTNDIICMTSKQFTIITVVNYDECQKDNRQIATHKTTHETTHTATHETTHPKNKLSLVNTNVFDKKSNVATHETTHTATHQTTQKTTLLKESPEYSDFPEESESFKKNTKKVLAPEQQPVVAKNATAQQAKDEVSPPVPPAGDTPPKGGGDVPKKSNSILSKPDDVCEQVWADYLALRRAKRAPITVTLMKTLRSEADKAKLSLEKALEMCINRNWQGFRADWLPTVAAPLPKSKPVFFNPNNAPPLKENVEILGIYNSNEENPLADSIKNITRL